MNSIKEDFQIMKHHVNTYTEAIPHKCEVRGKVFTETCKLKIQKLTHWKYPFSVMSVVKISQKMINLKPTWEYILVRNIFTDKCEKAFPFSATWKVHMWIHTGEKPFSCEACGKTIPQNYEWNQHTKIHTREKQFSYEVCSKAFSENDKLKIHMRMHTGEKPFQCKMCEKAFTISNALKPHMWTHTREKPS